MSVLVRNIGLMAAMVGLLSASSLDIYQDGAKYRTIPADNYLGFAKGVTAVCEGQSLALTGVGECSEGYRLCKRKKELETLKSARAVLGYESETLETLISLAKPTQIDAAKWIDAATKIGKHKAELSAKEKQVSQKIQNLQAVFDRQVSSPKPLFLQQKCAGELELTIPAGMIGARLLYEADVSDPAAIAVRQYIALSNRSGIDIVAKTGHIYARSYRVYLRPQEFSPWIARIRQETRALKKAKRANKMVYMEVQDEGGDIAAATPVASMGAVMQTGYKNYQFSGLELPSTGREIKVKIADYKVPAECELLSYPYRDSRVYRSCSFVPASTVESHRWRIEKNKRLVSDQAYGTYHDGKYLLNVAVEEEILIVRRPLVKRDRSSGIFGGTIKKKDGFTLTVTNLSDKAKDLKIIERIPTSTTDKIKVKLLKITGADSHKLLKDGRVEISLSLSPKEHREIKIMFEVRYDKEIEVVY